MWNVISALAKQAVTTFGFDGIISHAVSRRDAKTLAEAHIPIVLTEPWPEMHNPEHPLFNTPSVKMDSHGVGVLAAEYYLKRGYKSFAYVGETLDKYWSAERCAGFCESLAKAGYASTVYNSFTKRERRNWDAERPRMIRFLQKLPKPTAIFAAMDNRARLVLDACAEAGIRVPEEIAVLGVDNDPILCESAVPRLSSIWTGGFKRGQKAAEMLDCLMRGRAITDKHVNIGPISVISRESTGYDVMQDPAIARAIHFIRNNALLGRMDVNSVVQHAGCSRRYAEIRFRNELGSSIREFIIENRINHARHLLAESNLSIREIAERCGFSRDSHLAVLFKKNTGLTMRDYRSNYRATPDE
jgi:LacI family transcriptional regulator